MLSFFEWHSDPDGWLVALAGLIFLSACLIGLDVIVQGRARTVLCAAVIFASGLWSTLFAVMFALHPTVPIGYLLGVTALSVAAALATGWLGLAAALHRRPAERIYRTAAMMDARLSAELARLGDVVSRALAAAQHGSNRGRGFTAAGLLALAICGLDVIAIGAVPSETTNLATPTLAPIMLMPNIPPGPPIEVSAMLTHPGSARPLAPRQASAAAGRAIAGAMGSANSSTKEIAALATEIATAQQVDPLLVLAIIATESAFQSDAISPGNARGLMQLTPETGRRFGVRDLLDPAENIRAGTRYLRWLLTYFQGDLSLALAAYNAGEGAVLHYGGVPPFPETRHYLQRVRSLYPAERHPYEQLALR
jgi:NO-binding membrane sensor protein with MHYT domain